jgi:hypothetical protein
MVSVALARWRTESRLRNTKASAPAHRTADAVDTICTCMNRTPYFSENVIGVCVVCAAVAGTRGDHERPDLQPVCSQ